MNKLTKRQKQILSLFYFENRVIANKLNLQESTVKTHSNDIKNILNMDSKTKCLIYALKKGILKLEEIETDF